MDRRWLASDRRIQRMTYCRGEGGRKEGMEGMEIRKNSMYWDRLNVMRRDRRRGEEKGGVQTN